MRYTTSHQHELTQEMGIMYMALDIVTKFMAEWLDANLKKLSSDYWDRYVVAALYESQRKTLADNGVKTLYDLDQPTLLSVFLQNKTVLVGKLDVDQQLFGYAHGIKDIRNKYFHKNSKPLDKNRFKHDLETLVLFLEGLGASQDVVNEVKGQVDKMSASALTPIAIVNHASAEKSVIKISVSPVDNAKIPERAVQMNPEAKAEMKNKVVGVKNPVPTAPYLPLDKPIPNAVVSDKHEVDLADVAMLAYEEIKASTRIDCTELQCTESDFGECKILKRGDSVPAGITLVAGWQYAIILPIKRDDRSRIIREITSFNKIEVCPCVCGDIAVWQFPQPKVTAAPIEMQTKVFLPLWLKQYIHVERGLSYKTDCEAVQLNLKADKEFSFQYLATYFPRTFAEVGSIFDYVFQLPNGIVDALQETVYILDVGCGSGAAAAAIIWSLKKARLSKVKKICVYGFDGNRHYINRFEEIFPVLAKNWSSIDMELIVEESTDIPARVKSLPCDIKFDFIVSSKYIQELSGAGAFMETVSQCIPRVRDRGVLCMLENFREVRTERNCQCARALSGFKVQTSTSKEFSIGRIDGPLTITENIGYQLFIR